MAARPAVSVVVITYNDAACLPRAVRSLYAQTLQDLEIIVVDDASTDDTHDVAGTLPGVRYIRRERNSGGCGAPRNIGLDAARPLYIMFLDSDDELPRHARKALLTEIERTGADFVAGQIRASTNPAAAARPTTRAVHAQARGRGIQAEPGLFLDGFSTNKIYDVDFLRRHELRFREDLHYEDHVFTASSTPAPRGSRSCRGPSTGGTGPWARAGRSRLQPARRGQRTGEGRRGGERRPGAARRRDGRPGRPPLVPLHPAGPAGLPERAAPVRRGLGQGDGRASCGPTWSGWRRASCSGPTR